MTMDNGPGATHAQLLGEIVMEWSKVTPLLEELFSQLTGLDDAYVFRVLLERIRDRQLDEICMSLSGRLVDEQKEPVLAWLRLVRSARAKRNEFLHSVYLPAALNGELHTQLLGRARLDHENGIATPRLTYLTRADLTSFRGSVQTIQREFPNFLAVPSALQTSGFA